MRLAFVSDVAPNKVKKNFPWAKHITPFLGGIILTDLPALELQTELIRMVQKEAKILQQNARRRVKWEKKIRDNGGIHPSIGRPVPLK